MISDHSCACLAIYDWDANIDVSEFHEVAKSFFAANGVKPNVAGLDRLDGRSLTQSYTSIEERLRWQSPREFNGLDLYHTLPNYAQLIFGWDVTASMDIYRGKTMYFCCDQALSGVSFEYFERLLERAAILIKLNYAIGYLRQFELGPAIYASGMVTGLGYSDEEMAEADRIGSWFRERLARKRHLSGHLRDVYPLNVLSGPHLSQRVGGLPLADWIGQSRAHGTLRSLTGGAAVWRIEESNVDHVRAELAKTGLLIAYPPSSA